MKSDTIVLRQWTDDDVKPYASMKADVEVMRYFPRLLTAEESVASMLRLRAKIDQQGWGVWAVDVDGQFAGFTGLAEPTFVSHFTPCVEICWRFRRECWGRNIAFAAALAAQSFAFQSLRLAELVSFTAAINMPSRRLMERLGFSRVANEDFLHPALPPESPLRSHVLYRKRNSTLNRLKASRVEEPVQEIPAVVIENLRRP